VFYLTLDVPFPEDPDLNYKFNETQILEKLGCLDLATNVQSYSKPNAIDIINQSLNMDFGDADNFRDVETVEVETVVVERNEQATSPRPKKDNIQTIIPSSPEVFYPFADTPEIHVDTLSEPDLAPLPSHTPQVVLGMLGESGVLTSRQILGSSEFDLFSQD
jgi:hypothetical protein